MRLIFAPAQSLTDTWWLWTKSTPMLQPLGSKFPWLVWCFSPSISQILVHANMACCQSSAHPHVRVHAGCIYRPKWFISANSSCCYCNSKTTSFLKYLLHLDTLPVIHTLHVQEIIFHTVQ